MMEPNVLLVEDDLGDAELIRVTVERSGVPHALTVARDVEQALRALRDEQSRPSLVLLDLQLHGRSGLEVLRELKDSERWRAIPVVVLTASERELDVWRSYHLHANAYVVKSGDAARLAQNLTALVEFYLRVVTLPPTSASVARGRP